MSRNLILRKISFRKTSSSIVSAPSLDDNGNGGVTVTDVREEDENRERHVKEGHKDEGTLIVQVCVKKE